MKYRSMLIILAGSMAVLLASSAVRSQGDDAIVAVGSDDRGKGANPDDCVYVAPGTFIMGSPMTEWIRMGGETQHQVTLTHGVYVQTTEVTNQQYMELAQWAFDHGYVTATSASLRDNLDGSTQVLSYLGFGSYELSFSSGAFSCVNPDYPVKHVTWYGSAAYCDWLSLKQGLVRAYNHGTWQCNGDSPYAAFGYRLPTEAEWEYACRAGSTSAFASGEFSYQGCDPLDSNLDLMGWYCGNAGGWTHSVAQKLPNGWGLYEMHGNLREWCNDWYAGYGGTVTDPAGPAASDGRIYRGGSWSDNSEGCRSAYRNFYAPDYSRSILGFRSVRSNNAWCVPGVADVADDQGGQLTVSWPRHAFDAAGVPAPITEYQAQQFNAGWQTLTTVPAVRVDTYSVVVPTPDTMTLGQLAPYSRYRILARTANPSFYDVSLPDSGYSIDNIPPPTPVLNLYDSETGRVLMWANPGIPDFQATLLYRDTEPDFTSGDPLVTTTSTLYVENHLARYFYKIRFRDIHGNLSDLSNEVVGQYPTGVPAIPPALRLYPNQPNPFNPSTTLRFDLPVGGRVRLGVYDVAGRLLRTLLDVEMPAGNHEAVWDGRDSAGRGMASGSYFARLTANGKVETVRMGLVK